MASNKNSLNILKFRQKKLSRNIINKVEIKPFVIPYVFEKDDSTINYVKRVGGQVLQFYSLHMMDIDLGGNDVYYYLVSNLYPLNVEEDVSKHGLATISIEVYKTKIVNSFAESITSEGASFLSADIYKFKEYSYKDVGLDSIETNTAGLVSFDLVDFIRYTRPNSGLDSYASLSASLLSIDLLSFPFLYKGVEEVSTTALTTIEIEVR